MPLRICIVAVNAYPVIDPEVPGGIGGIETRSWLFAKKLAALPDCEVSFVVRHWQPLRQPSYQGVQLILIRDRLYEIRDSLVRRLKRSSQFPWFELSHPSWKDAVFLPVIAARKALIPTPSPLTPLKVLKQVDADVFLTFGVQSFSAHVIASAHATRRPAVLFLGSNDDLADAYLNPTDELNIYRDSSKTCRWVIDNADQILCQSHFQQERLQLFDREATVLLNPIDLENWEALLQRPVLNKTIAPLPRYVLWIGRAENTYKRPGDCLKVAEQCPEIPFVMIMNRRDEDLERQIRESAPANVHIVESVPFEEIPAIFKRAAVFVNTSTLEGFPNTFLQSMASGVPIASLNVESEFLKETQAGVCADGSIESLATVIRAYWKQPLDQNTREQIQCYLDEHHSLDVQAKKLAERLRDAIREFPAAS